MALANPGGPEQAPENQRMSAGLGGRIRGRSPIMEEIASLAGREAPHHGDHGRHLFNHPSTNRATTGLLNGSAPSEPAGSLGAPKNKTGAPEAKNPNPGGFSGGAVSGSSGTSGRPRGTTPFPKQRPVDITMPPTLTGDTSGTPGQGRAGY